MNVLVKFLMCAVIPFPCLLKNSWIGTKCQEISETIFNSLKKPTIWSSLEVRAEIMIYLLFGRIEAKKNCFWNFLTFIEHQRKNIFRYFLSDMDIEMLLLHFKSGFFLLQVCTHDFQKMASFGLHDFYILSWFVG